MSVRTCRQCGATAMAKRADPRYLCPTCRAAYKREWTERNKPRTREYFRRAAAKRRAAHPEKAREVRVRFQRDNRQQLRAGAQAAYAANPEKHRKQARDSYSKNLTRSRERMRIAAATRRAREVNAPGNGVTVRQWLAVIELHGGRCAYCGASGKMTLDHIAPLIRGGAHDPENIAPACISCNVSKGARFLLEWALASDGAYCRVSRAA